MTATLGLCPVTRDDLDAILAFETRNRAYFERWVPPRGAAFFDPDHQAEALQWLMDDPMGRYCLIRNASGDLLGRLNLAFCQDEAGQLLAEVGYRVGQDATGQGVASQAVRLALDWLEADGGFVAAQAFAMAQNRGSVRVLEKAGLSLVPGACRTGELGGRSVPLQLYRKALG